MSQPASPCRRSHRIETGSGLLLVREWGPPDGIPILSFHGTPSSGSWVPGGWSAPSDLGVRVITFDRPGYGGSTSVRGRRVVDAGHWVAVIADQLKLETFNLIGTGSGGPFAAAAAAVLGERVPRLCLSVSVGPDELPGFDPAAHAPLHLRYEIASARAGEPALRAFLSRRYPAADPLDDWQDLLPPCDVEVMSRREVVTETQLVQAEAVTQGFEGWVEDDLAVFMRSWGCDLAGITARTLLLYGLENVLVPSSHADAYRRALGHGQVLKVPHAGHWMRDVESEALRWLASSQSAPARFS